MWNLVLKPDVKSWKEVARTGLKRKWIFSQSSLVFWPVKKIGKKWTNPCVILYQWTWLHFHKETKTKIYRWGFGHLFKNKSLWDQSTWPVSGHCPLTGHYFDSYKENLKCVSSPMGWTQMGAKRRVTHLNPLLANTLFNLNIICGL